MLKKHKFNEKKLLHKIGKHWCVISIALLGLMGGVGVLQQRIHADSNNVATINTSSQLSKVNTTTNDSNNSDNTNQIQHGTWDNVNINYYPDNTMELTGNGTINPDHAPKSLPFNEDSNDWKLKINQQNANVTLNSSNGKQFSGIPNKHYKKQAWNKYAPIWYHFKSMDLSGLDTSKVTNMSYMFAGDENLRSVNLSGSFNTKNVPEESNNYNGGIAGMFEDTHIDKLTLGKNANFNKANQELFDDDPILDVNGNLANSRIMKGIQQPGTYYLASESEETNLHLIDTHLNKILSIQNPDLMPAEELKFPLVHDDNYQNILSHEMQRIDHYLNLPDGYKELSDDQQDYTIHNSHNANIGYYMDVKLEKDSNIHYKSDIVHDGQLSSMYSKKFQDLSNTDYDFSDSEFKLINSYGDILDGDIYTRYANSYTASQADSMKDKQLAALNAATSLYNNVEASASAQAQSQSNSTSQASSSNASADQSSNANSQSTSVSYVNVPTNNVDMSSYNDEINNLRNQVSSYSNEMNQMRGDMQSLESDMKNVKASASHSSNSSSNIRHHKRSIKRNYQLPRTNSKYWNRVRHLNVKHGFRVYQIHALAHHRNRVLRSKWIKPNRKVSVIRYRKSNKAWIISNHNLHHYKHYYWIYKGDTKNPNHFKFVK